MPHSPLLLAGLGPDSRLAPTGHIGAPLGHNEPHWGPIGPNRPLIIILAELTQSGRKSVFDFSFFGAINWFFGRFGEVGLEILHRFWTLFVKKILFFLVQIAFRSPDLHDY